MKAIYIGLLVLKVQRSDNGKNNNFLVGYTWFHTEIAQIFFKRLLQKIYGSCLLNSDIYREVKLCSNLPNTK